jgi:Zn-dependent M28 family amino/carboxypeptidase
MKLLFALALLTVLVVGAVLSISLQSPWLSYRGGLPELTQVEADTSRNLRKHLDRLCVEIGERDYQHPENLVKSISYIKGELESMGYEVALQEVPNPEAITGTRQPFYNIVAERRGAKSPGKIIVVGGHYDSVAGHDCVGADDNASAIAVLLELARLGQDWKPEKTLRFVAFCNEEPPFFNTDYMGSYVYAKNCRERGEDIEAMFCLEMLGYYSDERGSQNYPYPLGTILKAILGDRGNFVAFISNLESRELMVESLQTFRNSTKFPSHGIALPSFVTGVDWSDHRSFWGKGYKAIMIGDTALYRNKYYHTPEDTPDKLDYDKMARVTAGLGRMLNSKVEE